VVAHGWLYFIHGATGSIASVLQRPGWFLVVVAALLAASVFHEFGHASALVYEGGSVRGMGAGFYFIFPAFYTDVTDGYRLPRPARVRIDLGGPYFHLVFSVLVVTAYLITRQEFLLLIVVLIDFEVVRQFIPVLRLDGYWLFADLTGIPDPFSLVVPFLRRSRGVRDRTGGAPAPELKPVARRAFLGYLIITMVALPALLFLTVLHTPRIAELAWAALQERAQGVAEAAARGEVAGMAASLVETLLIALQLAGLAAFFYFIAWKPVRGAWRWSRDRPAPVRSIVRGTVLLAAGGFLLIFGALFPWLLAGPLIVDGIDSTAGRISLVCGALLVLAAVLVIAGRRPIVRRIAATLALGLGVGGAWMAGRGLIASQAELGLGIGPTVSYGLVVTTLGAVLALAGGLMATMTTLRARRSAAVSPPS
jgi:hypothetical protein